MMVMTYQVIRKDLRKIFYKIYLVKYIQTSEWITNNSVKITRYRFKWFLKITTNLLNMFS